MICDTVNWFLFKVIMCQIVSEMYFKLWYVVFNYYMEKKNTIHQVTTMLSTSKNVLFPGPNHLLTTGADELDIGHF